MRAQSCPTLCDSMDCITPGSSVHGIFQARILEWVAISSSRGSSQPTDRTRVSCVSCIAANLLPTGSLGKPPVCYLHYCRKKPRATQFIHLVPDHLPCVKPYAVSDPKRSQSQDLSSGSSQWWERREKSSQWGTLISKMVIGPELGASRSTKLNWGWNKRREM